MLSLFYYRLKMLCANINLRSMSIRVMPMPSIFRNFSRLSVIYMPLQGAGLEFHAGDNCVFALEEAQR